MDDLIADFLVEAHENLEVIDVELVRFEAAPDDRAALDRIFRLLHTLKGAGGFLGLARLEAVAHAGETLLGRIRDGMTVPAGSVGVVLSAIDRIREILAGLSAEGAETAGDDSVLIGELEQLSEGKAATLEPPPLAVGDFDPELGRALRPGEVSLAELEAAFQAAEAAPSPAVESVGEPIAPATAEAAADEMTAAPSAQSIRVGVDVLEGMMTLVSELVLTRNQLLQVNRQRGDESFSTPLQRLSAITGELQESVMKTRMQPIGQAWKKLPRLVRDLAKDLGKQIDLVLEGEGAELDRQVLESIRDPITHMVRNCADHGLETPEQRRAAGKPETGVIRLSAYHEGGSIVMRIVDDGRGLDTARIRDKAVEKGLATRAEAEAMSESAVHRLIFAPGFSTAGAITNVSGRGVGMDVVRSNIEQIGGQIELQSQPGQGSAVTVKIPLTLAIVQALIVGAGGQRFAVPQGAVQELIRVGPGSDHRVEVIGRTRMVRLREHLAPLIDLAGELGSEPRDGDAFVMIMQVNKHRFGVVVSEVIDTEEIVVKPLASVLRGIPLYTGATILGDGAVVLILDPNGLAGRAGEIPAAAQAAANLEAFEGEAAGERRNVLVVRAGGGLPKAVDLAQITRLEHARADQIETNGHRASLLYRGRLTPILKLDDSQVLRTEGKQPLIVFVGALFAMSLAVDEIIDVVETPLNIELASSRPGVLGQAVVAGRATEVIDMDHFMLLGLAEMAKAEGTETERAAA